MSVDRVQDLPRHGELEALFLDFGNTLVREEPSRFELYAREARAAGVDVDEKAMRTLMARAHRELPIVVGGAYRYTDRWFTAYIERIFHEYLGLDRARLGPFREHLFAVFSDAATFRLFPGALELLDRAAGAGLKIGIVSNWSPRLPLILERMGLAPRFDPVLASAVEGCEKPEPEIFARALTRAGVAGSRALHAGDHPEKDCAGARAAGLSTVLVDHSATMAAVDGVPRVTSLAELAALLFDT